MKQIEKELAWSIHRTLLLIRMAEEKVIDLYPSKQIKTPVHLCVGQEACAVGVCSLLSKEDLVYSTHRCHGHYLAKGGDLTAFFGELFGRMSGCCKGKGGSMHLCWPETGFMGSSAIVGGSIPIAAGAAWSLKLLGKNAISVSFFGDGACDEGVFWETLNFSSLKKLPILFVCENNLYATNSHVQARHAGRGIPEKVASFGIPNLDVDGNDVKEVYFAASFMIENIRNGKGPGLLHLRTYRLLGHVGPQPDWRPAPEIDFWKEKNPIKSSEKWQKDLGRTDDELQMIKSEISKEIEDAVNLAQKSPLCDASELLKDVIEDS